MPKSFCYITKKSDGIYIDCSYDEDFLETFKDHVPASDRSYDPVTQQWWVSKRYAKQAIRDARTFFENVMEV